MPRAEPDGVGRRGRGSPRKPGDLEAGRQGRPSRALAHESRVLLNAWEARR
jgi:hypothetical protein